MSHYDEDRPIWDMEPHYSKHVSAMTREGLHEKAAIAAELAYRDIEIERLTTENKEHIEAYQRCSAERESLSAENRELREIAIDVTDRWFSGLAVGSALGRLKQAVSGSHGVTHVTRGDVREELADSIEENAELGERLADSRQCEHDPVRPADSEYVKWGDYMICRKCKQIAPGHDFGCSGASDESGQE